MLYKHVIYAPLVFSGLMFTDDCWPNIYSGCLTCKTVWRREGDVVVEMTHVEITAPYLVRDVREGEKP